jgi:O-antigen/teichoic acid export membrane protein
MRQRIRRSFLSATSYSIVGLALAQGLNMVIVMALARILVSEHYGTYVYVVTTTGLFATLIAGGTGLAATRFIASHPYSTAPSRAAAGVNATLIGTVVLSSVVPLSVLLYELHIDSLIYPEGLSALVIVVSSLSFLLFALDAYFKCVLLGANRFRVFAFSSVVGPCLSLAVTPPLASIRGLDGAIMGMALSASVQCLVSHYWGRKILKESRLGFQWNADSQAWRDMLGVAVPALAASTIVSLTTWYFQFDLKGQGDLAEVALHGIAMQWYSILMFVPAVAGKILLPIFSGLVASAQAADSVRLLRAATLGNALVMGALGTSLMAASERIATLYGAAYPTLESLIGLVSVMAFLSGMAAPVGTLIVAHARMWTGVGVNLGWATISIVTYEFVSVHTAEGAICAVTLGYIFVVTVVWSWVFINHRRVGPAHQAAAV